MQARFHASLRIVSNCIHEFIMQRRYVFLLSTAAARPVRYGLLYRVTAEHQSESSLAQHVDLLTQTFEDKSTTPQSTGLCHGNVHLHSCFYLKFSWYISMSMFSITSSFLCCLSSTYSTRNAWSSLDFCIYIFIFSMLLAFLSIYLPQLSKQIRSKKQNEFLIYRL